MNVLVSVTRAHTIRASATKWHDEFARFGMFCVTDEFDIVSRVSDKNPNDKGHPIQYDTTKNQWFVHLMVSIYKHLFYIAD